MTVSDRTISVNPHGVVVGGTTVPFSAAQPQATTTGDAKPQATTTGVGPGVACENVANPVTPSCYVGYQKVPGS